MIIDKNELAAKLGKLKSILPSRPAIESLKGILLKNNALYANNLEMAMMTPLDIDTEERFILPQKAIEMIESLPSGQLKITSDKSFAITIEMNSIKNKFQSFDTAEFPEINQVINSGENVTVPGDILQDAMNSIIYAVSAADTKPALSGMLLESENGKLNLVATDGYRMAWSVVDYNREIKMIIPRSAVQKLLHFGLKGDVEILYNTRNAMFKLNEYTFYTRLSDGSFIDYRKIIPDCSNTALFDRSTLIESINRSCICADVKSTTPAILDISDSTVKVSTKSALGEYSEELQLDNEIDETIRIGFNARYLLDCLKSYKCPKIKLAFSGSLKPMVADDGQLKSLVLPVRLKD